MVVKLYQGGSEGGAVVPNIPSMTLDGGFL